MHALLLLIYQLISFIIYSTIGIDYMSIRRRFQFIEDIYITRVSNLFADHLLVKVYDISFNSHLTAG